MFASLSSDVFLRSRGANVGYGHVVHVHVDTDPCRKEIRFYVTIMFLGKELQEELRRHMKILREIPSETPSFSTSELATRGWRMTVIDGWSKWRKRRE